MVTAYLNLRLKPDKDLLKRVLINVQTKSTVQCRFYDTKSYIYKSAGKDIPTYPEEGEIINCSFMSFGGTMTTVNGVLSVVDTANIETWYTPEIKSDTRLKA